MSFISQGNPRYLFTNSLYVGWDPTYHCNYRCSYCGPGRPKGIDYCNEKDTLRIFDRLLEMSRDSYIFVLSGGEPTFNPHLSAAIRHISQSFDDKVENIQMFSNGSAKLSIYEDIASIKSTTPFSLCVSIHSEHVTNQRIIDLVTSLSNYLILRLDVMFNPGKRERVHEIFELILSLRERYPFIALIDTVWNSKRTAPDSRYTPDDYKWKRENEVRFSEVAKASGLKKELYASFLRPIVHRSYIDEYSYSYIGNYNDALVNGTCSLTDKYCVVGSHLINIRPDARYSGAICSAAPYSSTPLFDINPNDDPDFCKVIKCTVNKCRCMANTVLQKFLSRIEAEDFKRYHLQRVKLSERNEKEKIVLNKTINLQSNTIQYLENDNIKLHAAISRQKLLFERIDSEDFPYEKFIDQTYYFTKYPDVAQSGMSAQEHWCKYGYRERRNPTPWFDTCFYLSQFTGAEACEIDPFMHYILKGCLEGKLPSPEAESK